MDRADAKHKRYPLLEGAVGRHQRTNAPLGTRTRRAIARLRSYAIRGRVTAEFRLLDDGALARVKLYHSLFSLPHVLFKEIVSKL